MGADTDGAAGRIATDEVKAKGIRLRALNAFIIVAVTVLTLLLVQVMGRMGDAINTFEEVDQRFVASEQAAYALEESSRILSDKARSYSVMGDISYLDQYLEEHSRSERRLGVMALEREYGLDEQAQRYYKEAHLAVDQLISMDCHAIELMLTRDGTTLARYSDGRLSFALSPEEQALGDEERAERAVELLFSDKYKDLASTVADDLDLYGSYLLDSTESAQRENAQALRGLQFQQRVLSLLIFASVLLVVLSFVFLVIWPLRGYIVRVRNNEPLPPKGAFELQYLAGFYNAIFEERQQAHAKLQFEAERDQLTGLYNRRAFIKLVADVAGSRYALLLVDVDHFKEVNDTYGHSVGDDTLKKLGAALSHTFRSTDFVARIGGDEFAVVMVDADAALKDVICHKIEDMRGRLADDSDGGLAVTVSIGVAFNAGQGGLDAIYQDADKALYQVKRAGRNGYAFYDPTLGEPGE